MRNGECGVGILTWQKKAPKIGRPGQFLNPGYLLAKIGPAGRFQIGESGQVTRKNTWLGLAGRLQQNKNNTL